MGWDDRFGNSIRMSPTLDLDLVKARLKKEEAKRNARSFFEDPLDTRNVMGFKDNPSMMTYEMLAAIPHRLGIIAAILQTRCTQVAAFSTPFRASKSIGFKISPKHTNKEDNDLTKGEKEMILDLERFIYNCGQSKPNPYSDHDRDDFDTYLRKIVRDTLVYDQIGTEIVPDRRGVPYEFLAVDAASIRIAVDTNKENKQQIILNRVNQKGENAYTTLDVDAPINKRPAYVQLIDGNVSNVYSRDELAFGVRNPRSDIRVNGYGFSELEMLISTITSHLNAEKHNSTFFTNGSSPKGMINFKGDAMGPEQLEGFRRMWKEQMEGVQNFWRTPILQNEAGVEWINLHTNNRDMEYQAWLEYLLKISCSVFLIDPAELNFDIHGGQQNTPLFESSAEWKLKASRDKGLRPLLKFIATYINRHIISKIDDAFVFEFVGLDDLTEQEKHELRKEQVSSYMTLNEIRRAEDLPSLPSGDVVLNPTYMQAIQLEQQMKQQQEMAQQQAQPAQQPPPANQPVTPDQGQQPNTEGQQDADAHVPQYSDSFGKALGKELGEALKSNNTVDLFRKGDKFIEIDFDWKS